jgi:hypothetical protein
MRKFPALGLALFLLTPLLSAQTTGVVAAGVQHGSESDDPSTFKEQNEGADSGVFLDRLELAIGKEAPWRIDSRFTTGHRGWLDIEAPDGPWSGGLRLRSTRSWSAISFADDRLPSGVAVSSLFPAVTTLDPLFGVDEPHADLLQGDAWITRSLGTDTSLTLRVRMRERDGERVPNIGGFSFSEVGTPSFYSPGLERIDSSSTSVALEAASAWRGIALRFDTGVTSRENESRFDLPAWGSAALLDLNRWTTGTDATSRWVCVGASRPSERLSLQAGASWFDVASTPLGADGRVTPSGGLVREGLSVARGSVDGATAAGAAGFGWRIHPSTVLTVSADLRSQSLDGEGDLAVRSSTPVPTNTEVSTDRVGATVNLATRFGRSRLGIRGRFSTTETDSLEDSGGYQQDLTRSVDRTEIRADLSQRLTKNARARAWVRWADESTSVDLRTLDLGYALSDREREDLVGAIELALGRAARRVRLVVSGGTSDFVNAPPFFDPVFDPSVDYEDIDGQVSTFRSTVTGVLGFRRGTVWGEVGWLSNEYDFDSLVEQPGFASVDERIDGLVVSAGGEARPREGTRIHGEIEWVRDREDVDRTLTRVSLEVGQSITERFELFGRWFRGDADVARSMPSEYSNDLFALGIRANF